MWLQVQAPRGRSGGAAGAGQGEGMEVDGEQEQEDEAEAEGQQEGVGGDEAAEFKPPAEPAVTAVLPGATSLVRRTGS